MLVGKGFKYRCCTLPPYHSGLKEGASPIRGSDEMAFVDSESSIVIFEHGLSCGLPARVPVIVFVGHILDSDDSEVAPIEQNFSQVLLHELR